LLTLRLARVRELLEETDPSIERIVELTGFGSAVALRQLFVAEPHTPTAYRTTFRSTGPLAGGSQRRSWCLLTES
jgi:transcriptional regulator GlxA family with amidase domain